MKHWILIAQLVLLGPAFGVQKFCPTAIIENIAASDHQVHFFDYQDTHVTGPIRVAPGAEIWWLPTASGQLMGYRLIQTASGPIASKWRQFSFSSPDAIEVTALSKDGSRIAAGNRVGEIQVWDTVRYDRLLRSQPFGMASAQPTNLLFADGGHTLVLASADGTIGKFESSPSKGPFYQWRSFERKDGVEPGPVQIALSPDEKHLAGLYGDGALLRWDFKTGELIDRATLLVLPGQNTVGTPVLEYSPRGNYLLAGLRQQTLAKNVSSRRAIFLFQEPDSANFTASIYRAGVSPLTRVQSFFERGERGHNRIPITLIDDNSTHLVSDSQDQVLVAVGVRDGSVRIQQVESGEQVALLGGGHRRAVTGVVFSPTTGMLASVSLDGLTCAWDLRNKDHHCGVGHPTPLDNPVFSPDGNTLFLQPTPVGTNRPLGSMFLTVDKLRAISTSGSFR